MSCFPPFYFDVLINNKPTNHYPSPTKNAEEFLRLRLVEIGHIVDLFCRRVCSDFRLADETAHEIRAVFLECDGRCVQDVNKNKQECLSLMTHHLSQLTAILRASLILRVSLISNMLLRRHEDIHLLIYVVNYISVLTLETDKTNLMVNISEWKFQVRVKK